MFAISYLNILLMHLGHDGALGLSNDVSGSARSSRDFAR